jgi:OOP family OmpA-OmpF porin
MATVVGCDGYVEPVAAEPAPEPVVAAPVPMAMAPAAATVNFAFDRSDLDANATAAIDSLVSEAKSKGNIKAVRVTGHTDRVGAEEYNVGLSLRRAGAVNDYLVQNAGIGAEMIEMSGKGESEPLATCEGMRGAAALECLAPNRRAEIVFDLF